MKQTRSRLLLVAIFLLFGVPVVVAMLMHSPWWQYEPAGMTNRGTLVQPPVALDYDTLEWGTGEVPAEPPRDKWVILYPVTTPCVDQCLSDVESLRQIHRAAGRRQQNLLIMPLMRQETPGQTAALLAVYGAFLTAVDRNGEVYDRLGLTGDTGPDGSLAPGQAFLVDPSGNIMMRYAAGFDPGDLNKDLKRLLKWSAQDG